MGRIRFGRGPLSSISLPFGGLLGYGRTQTEKDLVIYCIAFIASHIYMTAVNQELRT
jgi:hypothetical protein